MQRRTLCCSAQCRAGLTGGGDEEMHDTPCNISPPRESLPLSKEALPHEALVLDAGCLLHRQSSTSPFGDPFPSALQSLAAPATAKAARRECGGDSERSQGTSVRGSYSKTLHYFKTLCYFKTLYYFNPLCLLQFPTRRRERLARPRPRLPLQRRPRCWKRNSPAKAGREARRSAAAFEAHSAGQAPPHGEACWLASESLTPT